MRAFIAINIPAPYREALAQRAAELEQNARDLRWVNQQNMHLTLAFLGEVPAQNVDSIRSGMDVAAHGHSAFSLGFGGGGTFPRRGEPRVAWVGFTGDLDAARDLQADVSKAMRGLGLRVDQRPFSPHVTVARINRQATPSARIAIARRFEQLSLDDLGQFTVPAISLMESDLTDDGAIYRDIIQVELGGSGTRPPPAGRRFGFFRRA